MSVEQETKKQVETVKLTIDGREVEAPKGQMLLQAALDMGIDIPHYCYHKHLSIAGNCRMCLVEVEKMPKLAISCNLPVAEGMVVRTQSEQVLQARRAVLELQLINHPIDCPVCDQAGECYLQNYYMEHGQHSSRMPLDEKERKPKHQDLGPNIILDSERCIQCARCIRFCDEVTGTSEMGIYDRGHEATIGTFKGRPLSDQNHYQGCLADICPVGALTDKQFRFKMRVWFMKRAKSICPGCSTGCNIYIDAKDDKIYRLKPRDHGEVNLSWMCDEGRYGFQFVNAANRAIEPLEKTSLGDYQKVSWDSALTAIQRGVADTRKANGAGSVAIVGSAQLTNEDLYALKRLSEAVSDGTVYWNFSDASADPAAREDEILRRLDKNPNSRGCQALGLDEKSADISDLAKRIVGGEVKAVLIFDARELLDTERGQELAKSLDKAELAAVFTTLNDPALQRAKYILPATTFAEKAGTFTNYEGRVQRLHRAIPARGHAFDPWVAVTMLLHLSGQKADWDKVNDVFAELASKVAAFEGLDLDAVGDQGALIK